MRKFTPALGANQPMDSQRAFPVVTDWGYQAEPSSKNSAACVRPLLPWGTDFFPELTAPMHTLPFETPLGKSKEISPGYDFIQ